MLATLALTQASLVLAACGMERGQLAQVLAEPADHACCDEMPGSTGGDGMPMSANACLAQSTADLQVSGGAMPIFVDAGNVPVLLLPACRASAVPRTKPVVRDRVPPRILLHSFLI